MIHYIDEFPGREIKIGDQNYLYFGGTAYLGLQTDKRFQRILIRNIRKYGTNYGASRISNIRLSVYDQAENYLTKLVGSEACSTLSSGYLAGQFVSQYFNSSAYKVFYAPNSHPALHLSENNTSCTYEDLKRELEVYLKQPSAGTPVVFLDAIDFTGNSYPNFNGLKTMPLNKIIVVADDSHGIGVVGDNGGGVFKTLLALGAREIIVCCSLGKGFGLQAGAVFGTRKRIQSMTETAFYGGASPATPATLATILDTGEILANKREKLNKRMLQFRKQLPENHNFSIMDGHPAISFANKEFTFYLEKNNIIVTNFPYPNEDSSTMSRIVLSSSHKKKDLSKLSHLIKKYFSAQI
ncbi:8-amino-7-oxononanoate synthase [Sediminicola sp. YIK13]|uniref:aminotransferase class I/II-fold pyridoxal phosphate-dependent enzyme n=1 Tax=Sediminicola sp. YIK13 TaxID=1453352 RepID=UPI0007207A5C|nr:aminotransferase class I/II-fold pyridoxal phosphate-dependent enzyme [Sediminicola sp. YIK13]ALM07446.1 8-amino-7-oxononanoate synthase [Sediminicola sp. YIK13]